MKYLDRGTEAIVFKEGEVVYLLTHSLIKVKYLTQFKLGDLLGEPVRGLFLLRLKLYKKLSKTDVSKVCLVLKHRTCDNSFYPSVEELNKFIRENKCARDSYYSHNVVKEGKTFIFLDPVMETGEGRQPCLYLKLIHGLGIKDFLNVDDESVIKNGIKLGGKTIIDFLTQGGFK